MRLSAGRLRQAGAWLAVGLQLVPFVGAIDLNPNSEASYKAAAKLAADGLKTFYSGDTPGLFDDTSTWPWWIGGGMFMELIEYANLTGDDSWDNEIQKGLLEQIGPDEDFRPDAQFYTEANDDQLYWGMAAMTAAEHNFNPPPSDQPSWLSLAQAVFNRINPEWNSPAHCGGGFRWQYNPATTNPVRYKNTATNGGYFMISARLATYTNNATYAEWAEKTFNWMESVSLVDQQHQDMLFVNDGVNNPSCSKPSTAQYSYNPGVVIGGAAYMYRYYSTKGDSQKAQMWMKRVEQLAKGIHYWYWQKDPQWGNGLIMAEYSCELRGECNADQTTFKGYTTRWLSLAAIMVPMGDLSDQIFTWIKTSSIGAAKQCSGGSDGNTCGIHWYQDQYDGTTGPGQQMSAMSVFANNIIRFSADSKKFQPLTSKTGGDSEGDPSAGTGPSTVSGTEGIADTIWTQAKVPVIAAVCGVLGIASLVAGYFIWKKWFRKPKLDSYKEMGSEQNFYQNEHQELTPTLPNVQYNYGR